MWPDASLAHRRRKGSKHLYNPLLTKQNQKWCSHRAPEKVFALLRLNCSRLFQTVIDSVLRPDGIWVLDHLQRYFAPVAAKD